MGDRASWIIPNTPYSINDMNDEFVFIHVIKNVGVDHEVIVLNVSGESRIDLCMWLVIWGCYAVI
jgi:hypothetical protein